MPYAEINIEIYCAECGEGLCNQTNFAKTRHRNEPSFRVQPCKKCLDNARNEGYEAAQEEAAEKMAEMEASHKEEIELAIQSTQGEEP